MAFQINVGDVKATVLFMRQLTRQQMVQAGRATGEAMAAVLEQEVRTNISRTDHTLSDLAKKDHPYARRHGAIQASRLGSAFVKRPYMVHRQSGQLLAALRSEVRSGGASTPARGAVFFDLAVAPHARHVVLGTRMMMKRDVLWLTAKDPETTRQMMKAAVRVLGKTFRTQARIRFEKGSS